MAPDGQVPKPRRACGTMAGMGYEYRVRFELNPLDPRAYAPDVFLAQLAASVPSVECKQSASHTYEYRTRGATDAWPAVVITVEPDGFFVLENDGRIGTELLGRLVKYALGFAKDDRVTIEGA